MSFSLITEPPIIQLIEPIILAYSEFSFSLVALN
jgi:hypothetical protein